MDKPTLIEYLNARLKNVLKHKDNDFRCNNLDSATYYVGMEVILEEVLELLEDDNNEQKRNS